MSPRCARALLLLAAACSAPPERPAKFAAGRAMLAAGDVASAVAWCNERAARELHPRTPYFDLYEDAVRRGAFDQAEALLAACGEPPAVTILGDGRAFLQQSLARRWSAASHEAAAAAARDRGDPGAAGAHLAIASELRHGHVGLGREAAELLIAGGRPFDATRALHRIAASGDPGVLALQQRLEAELRPQLGARLAVAARLLEDRQLEAAAVLLEEIGAVAPPPPDWYLLRARVHLQQAERDAALDVLDQGVALGAWHAGTLRDDPSLSLLRDWPRFTALLADLERPSPPATSLPAEWVEPNTGIRFRRVPAGQFLTRRRDRSLERIRVGAPFLLAATEITQAQWSALMPANPSCVPGPDLPVECVSHDQALEFCRRLAELHPDASFTLPTEAQWEHACRAGSRHEFGFAAGTVSDHAHVGDDAPPQPVARLRPNAWGFFDLLGNADEWCADPWLDDSGRTLVPPVHPVRGGSSRFPERFAHPSHRVPADASDGRYLHHGFRVVYVPGRDR
jgi:formylglycine-generating enzyme required for sulfatase activity